MPRRRSLNAPPAGYTKGFGSVGQWAVCFACAAFMASAKAPPLPLIPSRNVDGMVMHISNELMKDLCSRLTSTTKTVVPIPTYRPSSTKTSRPSSSKIRATSTKTQTTSKKTQSTTQRPSTTKTTSPSTKSPTSAASSTHATYSPIPSSSTTAEPPSSTSSFNFVYEAICGYTKYSGSQSQTNPTLEDAVAQCATFCLCTIPVYKQTDVAQNTYTCLMFFVMNLPSSPTFYNCFLYPFLPKSH